MDQVRGSMFATKSRYIRIRVSFGCSLALVCFACARAVDSPLDEPLATSGSGGAVSGPGTGGSPTGSVGSGGVTSGGGGSGGTETGAGGDTGTTAAGGSAGDGSGGGGAGGSGGSGGDGGSGGSAGSGGSGGMDAGTVNKPTGITVTGQNATALQAPSAGGGAFRDTCATNEVVIGYTGTVDAPDASTNYLRSFRAICGKLSISGTGPYAVVTAQAETLTQHGTLPGSQTQNRMCSANQMVVGFGGRSGGFIDQLAFICAPLTISGASPNFTLALGATATLAGLGGPGGSPFTAINCPAGQIAVGDAGRSGGAIDAFGLLCGTPSLIVQ